MVLMLNLIFEFNQELSLNLTYSDFPKLFHSEPLGLRVNLLELVIEYRRLHFEVLLEASFEFVVGILLCFEAFVFADVAPC